MTAMDPPITAVLFDVGGVVVSRRAPPRPPLQPANMSRCQVRSPLLAIEAYEAAHGLPPGYINWNIYHSSPDSAWKKLERNEIPMDDDSFFHPFHADLNCPRMWAKYHKEKASTLSPVPFIDAKWLFWEMMRTSRELDQDMLGAIRSLRETRKYRLGALTNNYIFPQEHPYRDDRQIKSLFDVYIASAEIGMRKPEHRIFEHAIKTLGVESASQIVFLDDLGGNLRAAKQMGLRTIKVPLRGTQTAIKQLEDILGEALAPLPSKI
ncbi:hypothetical protein DRE_06311 [Drechslerella stenobrocha 248]|uniref:Uncharacterized protein n=1 Tax=Drechslerella stenobrocha 248 TaxID=1043628 RepID=W7HM17_9PEZI|nr:hypothetical protein DRE_06311 [Drechslerella stenobrocha 248]